MTAEDIITIDVSDGKPIAKTLAKATTVILKGKHVKEATHELTFGSYVFAEVLKNIYTTNGRGGYEKVGKQYFLVAEKTL